MDAQWSDNNFTAVLVAESDPQRAQELARCLQILNVLAKVTFTAEQVLAAIRERIYHCAVVADDLAFFGVSAVACLSRLPSMECLIAVGDGGDGEARARRWGATMYLLRPESTAQLAEAIRLPLEAAFGRVAL